MDRNDAAKVAEILRANPDGISRPGLMAWARLRIASDLTDRQLDAALAALGAAVSIEGGFVRLVAAGEAGRQSGPDAVAMPAAASGARSAEGGPPAEWGIGATPRVDDPRQAGGPLAPRQPVFSTVALLDGQPPSGGSGSSPAAWVAGSRPRRSIRGLMTLAALVAVGVLAFVGRSASDGTSAGSTALASDPRGSIAAAGELGVGSCFLVPVATTFSEVESRPCDAPHDGEVVATWDYEQAGSIYPTEAEWQDGIDARCQARFEAYTGIRLAGQSELTYSWFVPAEDAWAQGSRTVQCFLAPAQGTLTRSYRASP